MATEAGESKAKREARNFSRRWPRPASCPRSLRHRRSARGERAGAGRGIGCGGQGNWDMADFVRQPNVEIVGLCDVYQGSIDDTLDRKRYRLDSKRVKTYKDFRRARAQRRRCGDHRHARSLARVDDDPCLRGRKRCIRRKAARADDRRGAPHGPGRAKIPARHPGRDTAASAPHFPRAAEMVRAGRIGKVARVHAWNVGKRPGRDRQAARQRPPPGLDWDLYLGPAPKVPFNPSRFLEFRWFWDYSGGMMTDWGVHLMDIIHWAMGIDAPTAVSASGGKLSSRTIVRRRIR